MPNLIGTVPHVVFLVGLHISYQRSPRFPSSVLARLPCPYAVVPACRPPWPALTVIPAVIGPASSRIKPPLSIPVPYTAAVPVVPYNLGQVAVGFGGYRGFYPRDHDKTSTNMTH